LKENNGELPKIVSAQKFNKYIKEVCEEVGIGQELMGKKMDPDTKRKKKRILSEVRTHFISYLQTKFCYQLVREVAQPNNHGNHGPKV